MRNILLALFITTVAFGQSFPSRLPTTQDLPAAVNNAQSQLTAAITANARSFTVLDPGIFRVPGYVTISGPSPDYANREVILICTIQGNTLSVCPNGRGVDSLMPAAYHKYGDTVSSLINAEYINHLNDLMIAVTTALGVNLGNVIKTNQSAGGDLSGYYPNPVLHTVGGQPLPSGLLVGTTDAQTLTNKTISGVFTGPLHGNADTAATASQLAADPSGCISGKYGYSIHANGNLDCKFVDWSELTGRPSALPPNGTASGDLGGSYPAPTVATVGGRTASQIASTVDAVSTFTSGTFSLQAYSLVYTNGTPSPPRSKLNFLPGLQVSDDGVKTNVALQSTGVTAGTYGSNVKSVQMQVTADGRVTSIQEYVIPGTAGSGYTSVKNGITTLTARNTLQATGGLFAADDSINNLTAISLGPSGVTAGSYGNASNTVTLNVESTGRILSATSVPIAIDGSQVTAGTINNSRLNAASLATANTLVLRDSGGAFSGSLTGNASTATNVGWSGITSKPNWATGTGIPGSYLRLKDVGCGSGYQGVSCDNNNDGQVDFAETSGTTTHWTGDRPFTWSVGNGINWLMTMTNIVAVFKNSGAAAAGFQPFTCWVPVPGATVTVDFYNLHGVHHLGTAVCDNYVKPDGSWTSWPYDSQGNAVLTLNDDLSYKISAVSGNPTSVTFMGSYSVLY